jgi:hypothetical protein
MIAANNLILNLDKTNTIKFITHYSPQCAVSTRYKENRIQEAANTKFLGLHTDNQVNLNNHINQIIPKLQTAHAFHGSTVCQNDSRMWNKLSTHKTYKACNVY